MPKVVVVKATGEVIYRQIPDFQDGKGIKNALFHHPEYDSTELEEKVFTEAQFKKDIDDMHKAQEAVEKAKKDALKAKTGWDDDTIDKIKEYFK